MLRRIRWFLFGLTAGIGGSAWLVTKARLARERLTPANAARVAAELLDAGSRRLAR